MSRDSQQGSRPHPQPREWIIWEVNSQSPLHQPRRSPWAQLTHLPLLPVRPSPGTMKPATPSLLTHSKHLVTDACCVSCMCGIHYAAVDASFLPLTLAWFKSLFLLCVCAWGWWHMTPHMCGGQRITCKSHFPPSMRVLRMDCRSSGSMPLPAEPLTDLHVSFSCVSICVCLTFSVFYLIF